MGHHDLVTDAGLLERPQGEQLVVGVVFDQEDDLGTHLAPGPSLKGLHVLVLSGALVYLHGISLSYPAGAPQTTPRGPSILSAMYG